MVAVVAEEHVAWVVDLEVEATLHSRVGLHAAAQFLRRAAVELCHCHGGDTILDIDGYGMAQRNLGHRLQRRYEVEDDLAVADADVGSVEVSLVAAVGVGLHPLGYVGLHLQSCVEDQRASGLYQFGVVAEALQVSLLCAVDVEMVGIGRGDDRHPGAQPVEGTVKLIGLYDHIVACQREDVVAAHILRDASEKSRAADTAFREDMRCQCTCAGLSVCS